MNPSMAALLANAMQGGTPQDPTLGPTGLPYAQGVIPQVQNAIASIPQRPAGQVVGGVANDVVIEPPATPPSAGGTPGGSPGHDYAVGAPASPEAGGSSGRLGMAMSLADAAAGMNLPAVAVPRVAGVSDSSLKGIAAAENAKDLASDSLLNFANSKYSDIQKEFGQTEEQKAEFIKNLKTQQTNADMAYQNMLRLYNEGSKKDGFISSLLRTAGIAMGAYGGGLTNSPNLALQAVNAQIDAKAKKLASSKEATMFLYNMSKDQAETMLKSEDRRLALKSAAESGLHSFMSTQYTALAQKSFGKEAAAARFQAEQHKVAAQNAVNVEAARQTNENTRAQYTAKTGLLGGLSAAMVKDGQNNKFKKPSSIVDSGGSFQQLADKQAENAVNEAETLAKIIPQLNRIEELAPKLGFLSSAGFTKERAEINEILKDLIVNIKKKREVGQNLSKNEEKLISIEPPTGFDFTGMGMNQLKAVRKTLIKATQDYYKLYGMSLTPDYTQHLKEPEGN